MVSKPGLLLSLFLIVLGCRNRIDSVSEKQYEAVSTESDASYVPHYDFVLNQLDFNGLGKISAATFLQFGPDSRLYIAELQGQIHALKISKSGFGNYKVTDFETIDLVQTIPNHDDDGTLSPKTINREMTAIAVGGTPEGPVIYASSSDPRMGGPLGDLDLDTNSGIITRIARNGEEWTAVDLIRGLPRSEENHATHGLELCEIKGQPFLLVCQGGHTNAGSPSKNFAYANEYALSAAILALDLNEINALPVRYDQLRDRNFVYDLPTLDDPTRININGIHHPLEDGYTGMDPGDPFGGNDGLNQAVWQGTGPLKVFATGFRNSYDLVVTSKGQVVATDNGPNNGWGGYPVNEGSSGRATNQYRTDEPGSMNGDGREHKVNNADQLVLIANQIDQYPFGMYYGGHPNPIRANPEHAGLYTKGKHSISPASSNDQNPQDGQFRNRILDPGDVNFASQSLPVNWPPVALQFANKIEGDYRQPGQVNPNGDDDRILAVLPNNSNGIDEYTSAFFDGKLQGNLIIGHSGGNLHRAVLTENGELDSLYLNWMQGLKGNPLGIECAGDESNFPGTIWVATFNEQIHILEPAQPPVCILPGDPEYDPLADNDFDGFSNEDELKNHTNMCSALSMPGDFDGDQVSDLLDTDDDNDDIPDWEDPFQLGEGFTLPVKNEFYAHRSDLKGYLGLGLTGLMNNGNREGNYLDWLDKPNLYQEDTDDIYGGAVGGITLYQTRGSAGSNSQQKGFQYGVRISRDSDTVLVTGRMLAPLHRFQSGQFQGIQIGSGFQDNYIAIALTRWGLQVSMEVDDHPSILVRRKKIPRIKDFIDLHFVLIPAVGVVQFAYSIDGKQHRIPFGPSIATKGVLLECLQSGSRDLAVGILGSAGSGDEFATHWDFLHVEFSARRPNQSIVYRVNAAGPDIESIDGGPDWISDGTALLESHGFECNNKSNYFFGKFMNWGEVNERIKSRVPTDIFVKEKYNPPEKENLKYSFKVQSGKNYRIRLFIREGYTMARSFSVTMDGQLVEDFADIQPAADFGFARGGLYEAIHQANDSVMVLEFIPKLDNPLVCGIEILDRELELSANENPLPLASRPDREERNREDANTSTESALRSEPGEPDQLQPEDDGPGTDERKIVWNHLEYETDHIPRHENSFVQAGNAFYLFGGREQPEIVERFDLENREWSKVSEAPKPFNHFQALEHEGYVWVIATFSTNTFPNEIPESHIYLFDPVSNDWIQGREIPAGRRRGGAGVVCHDDQFYILGGNTIGHNGGFVPWLDVYDPLHNNWTMLEDAPYSRDHFQLVVIDDHLIAAGGRHSGGEGGYFAPLIKQTDMYDMITCQWSDSSEAWNIPTPRAGTASVVLDNLLYVIGGEGGGIAHSITEVFDPQLRYWETLGHMQFPRHGTQAIASGKAIFITSGSPQQGGGNQTHMEYFGRDVPNTIEIQPSTLQIKFENDPETDTEILKLSAINGTQGIYIREIRFSHSFCLTKISGLNGVGGFLIKSGSTHTLRINRIRSAECLTTGYVEVYFGTDSSQLANLPDNY